MVLLGPGLEDFAYDRNHFVNQNQFAPLSYLGKEMGFYFGVSDDLTKVSRVNGDQWCNPQEGCVPSSNLDGFELLKGGSEPLLL